MKSSSSFLAFVLATSSLLACGGSPAPEGTERFAELSASERTEMIEFAGGAAFDSPVVMTLLAAIDSEGGCPSIAFGAGVATITGGCTTADGVVYAGTLTARNTP